MLLDLNDQLRGKSGVSNVITYSIFGKNTTGYAALGNPIAQGTLSTNLRLLYTADRDITITEIQLANTSSSAVSGVILYLNGTAINGAFTIPANATFSYYNGVWNTDTNTTIFTGVGTSQITVSATPPPNPSLHDLWIQI